MGDDRKKVQDALFGWSRRLAKHQAAAEQLHLRVLSFHFIEPAPFTKKIAEMTAEQMEIARNFERDVRRSTASRIETPPGLHLNRLAQLLPKHTYERVFKPCIADMHKDYFDALQAGDERAAQLARFWGVANFWWHAVKLIFGSLRTALKLRS